MKFLGKLLGKKKSVLPKLPDIEVPVQKPSVQKPSVPVPPVGKPSVPSPPLPSPKNILRGPIDGVMDSVQQPPPRVRRVIVPPITVTAPSSSAWSWFLAGGALVLLTILVLGLVGIFFLIGLGIDVTDLYEYVMKSQR